MAPRSERKRLAERILEQLERCRVSREQITAGGELTPAHRRLAGWQAARLAHTHRAFFADPRYRPAVTFFLTDLYGERDYTPRDEGMERVYPLMSRMMPVRAMHSIALGIEMHALSQELDIELARRIYSSLPEGAPFSAADYAASYRACDNVPARRYQIELIGLIGRDLDHVVHLPLVYQTVLLSRRPARMAGLTALHEFIERGFQAFRHMRGADVFLEEIMAREFAVMDAIIAGTSPAAWAHPGADDEPGQAAAW